MRSVTALLEQLEMEVLEESKFRSNMAKLGRSFKRIFTRAVARLRGKRRRSQKHGRGHVRIIPDTKNLGNDRREDQMILHPVFGKKLAHWLNVLVYKYNPARWERGEATEDEWSRDIDTIIDRMWRELDATRLTPEDYAEFDVMGFYYWLKEHWNDPVSWDPANGSGFVFKGKDRMVWEKRGVVKDKKILAYAPESAHRENVRRARKADAEYAH